MQERCASWCCVPPTCSLGVQVLACLEGCNDRWIPWLLDDEGLSVSCDDDLDLIGTAAEKTRVTSDA